MPIYVYQCQDCGVTFERRQLMSEPPLSDCPECGGHVHRVIQPVGIVFKGSGFYVTDHRSPSSTALPGAKQSDQKDKVSGSKEASTSAKSEKADNNVTG